MKKLTIVITTLLMTKMAMCSDALSHFCYQDGFDQRNKLTLLWTDCFDAHDREEAKEICQKITDDTSTTNTEVKLVSVSDRGRCTRLVSNLIIANRFHNDRKIEWIPRFLSHLDFSMYDNVPTFLFHWSFK